MTQHLRRLITAIAIVGLAACGGSDDAHDTGAVATADGRTVDVRITGHISVRVGGRQFHRDRIDADHRIVHGRQGGR